MADSRALVQTFRNDHRLGMTCPFTFPVGNFEGSEKSCDVFRGDGGQTGFCRRVLRVANEIPRLSSQMYSRSRRIVHRTLRQSHTEILRTS